MSTIIHSFWGNDQTELSAGGRRIENDVKSLMYDTVTVLSSSLSNRVMPPKCLKEQHRRSFLAAAVRLYNQSSSLRKTCYLNCYWKPWHSAFGWLTLPWLINGWNKWSWKYYWVTGWSNLLRRAEEGPVTQPPKERVIQAVPYKKNGLWRRREGKQYRLTYMWWATFWLCVSVVSVWVYCVIV